MITKSELEKILRDISPVVDAAVLRRKSWEEREKLFREWLAPQCADYQDGDDDIVFAELYLCSGCDQWQVDPTNENDLCAECQEAGDCYGGGGREADYDRMVGEGLRGA